MMWGDYFEIFKNPTELPVFTLRRLHPSPPARVWKVLATQPLQLVISSSFTAESLNG
jgi:hypothetical protein